MGEGVTEATVTRWLVKEGDKVEEDQIIVELATDKVDNELPSPVAGIVARLHSNEGDVVQVGKTIAIVSADGKLPGEMPKSPEEIRSVAVNTKADIAVPEDETARIALSPLVRNMVKENRIPSSDLMNIKGSGIDGRIVKEDIERYLEERTRQKSAVPSEKTLAAQEARPIVPVSTATPPENKPVTEDFSVFGDVEVVEMSRIRRLIAGHMLHSVQTSPHVTSFIKADITNLFNWYKSSREEFERKEREKLTLMPILVKETVRALRDFPAINASLSGNSIVLKKYFHIGMAAALPDGNLIVPVIKNADQKNLYGLAKSINDLSQRARNNQLQPDEIKGSSFTITNLGSFGTLTGTPIINQPEAAILALGAIRKEPAVIETPEGDAIAIRQIITLALTYDHRIIDGALAGKFLMQLVKNIESFDIKASI
jgi:2-oxoglutarate dehydrogenase E2 component (dihydrolipoamide succinyltransferase)